jgi:peptidoglycan/xylan/chitin deacetylase (PgdA/CDA1 family)/tetratricopeptide (TPR) repeat protein
LKKRYLIALVIGIFFVAALIIVFTRIHPFSQAPVNPLQAPNAVKTPLQNNLDQIVANYRKVIVLFENEESLDEQKHENITVVGRYLFYENDKLLKALSAQLAADLNASAKGGFLAPPSQIEAFLTDLETNAEWHDADKLVFTELLDDLADDLTNMAGEQKIRKNLLARLEDDLAALREIRGLYNKELEKIFGRFETRGMAVRREKWENYLSYIKTQYLRDDILREYQSVFTEQSQPRTRGNKKTLSGFEFPQKCLALTFDDGPHRKYTNRIADILKQYGIKAVFFEVGQNLGTVKNDGKAQPSKLAPISRQLKDSGHSVANHSYTHALFIKLDENGMDSEIDKTNTMINAAVQSPSGLFRPPYGAQNDKLLAELDKKKMKSVLWNIDSEDWADPIPASIANRVLRTVTQQKQGIILFHDIHERTVEALPLILETLKKDGYTFLAWNGSEFVSDKQQAAPAAAETQPSALYRESWAVIVGIDQYLKWPKLQYAVNDARAVREMLINKYRFKAGNIQMLLNQEATRENILSALGDSLGDAKKIRKDDRVLIFFAGHGATRKLPSGRYLGYIVPFEADLQNYQGQSISMTNFQDISEAIPAKHVFFVMDSCYSGLGLTRGGAPVSTANYLREVSRRASRQMLTAGGMDEEVADNGPNGHSVFTWTFLQGLEGKADLNTDGYITASELAAYLGPGVSAISRQTPSFGNMPGSEGGDFIFDRNPEMEYLSEQSVQLDEEAIRLNSQLEKIRSEVARKKMRNEQLRKELASVQNPAGAGSNAQGKDSADQSRVKIAGHMELGNAFFREKKYPEALREFMAAYQLKPNSALTVNNIGYVYFKMEKYEESVRWFEKAIALDPKRSVAYLNLGEVYLKLNKKAEAKKALTRFLELAPNSRSAPEISAKLKTLD